MQLSLPSVETIMLLGSPRRLILNSQIGRRTADHLRRTCGKNSSGTPWTISRSTGAIGGGELIEPPKPVIGRTTRATYSLDPIRARNQNPKVGGSNPSPATTNSMTCDKN